MSAEDVGPANGGPEVQARWRDERRKGILVIGASMPVAIGVWFAVRALCPVVPDMESAGARMLFTLKCSAIVVLFAFATIIEAVAHERLRSAAFDPLRGHETPRLRVNFRVLQNTLEQLVVFMVGLFGLAAYCPDGDSMRAVPATAVVWVLARFAFWIGYHRSAAMRGLGAPGMAMSLVVLLYVAARVGDDVAGRAGAMAVVAAFLAFEAALFRMTRPSRS